ncbi:hypothetical protein GCM10028791_44270 [Echinicola sediminis]
MLMDKILDFYWYHIRNLKRHERKLIKYQGFGDRSIIKFKRESELEWSTISKILDSIKILDGLELRNHIRTIYSENKELFDHPDTYVTHFGPIGKSGAFVVNQFLRCFPGKQRMIIANSNSELSKLPENASIIFLDDFIGTGKQGLDYIKQVSPSLNSSIKPYLFTICGTREGIELIDGYRSNFKIKTQVILSKETDHLLDPSNKILNENEKKRIIELNQMIGIVDKNKYHLGLPFAFYYSAPDNALGILWSDNTKYKNKNIDKRWYGLIPREY